MSTARRTHASLYNWIVYKRGSKARERKEKNSSAARYFMRSLSYVTCVYHNLCLPSSTVFHQHRNITRPCLLARRFILARALTSLHKSVLHLPFYSPSSIFSFLPNVAHPPHWISSPWLSFLAPPVSYFTPLLASTYI